VTVGQPSDQRRQPGTGIRLATRGDQGAVPTTAP